MMMYLTPAERWGRATWASYWAVMLAFALNTAMTAPADLPIIDTILAGMTLWLVQTLLLWAFFPAMKRRHPRRLSWFGYILLIYLPFCMVGAFQPPHLTGVLMVLTIIALFITNAYWVRALKRQQASA